MLTSTGQPSATERGQNLFLDEHIQHPLSRACDPVESFIQLRRNHGSGNGQIELGEDPDRFLAVSGWDGRIAENEQDVMV